MKNLKDAEVQQFIQNDLIERDETKIKGLDKKELKTYQLLFDLLDDGPEGGLPYDFPARLAKRIQAGTDRRISLIWYLLAFAIGCVGIELTYGLLSVYNTACGEQFYRAISTYKWIFIFFFVFLLSIHYLDKRLVIKATG